MNHLMLRKPGRLEGYDYSKNGAHFVTICAKNHEEILSTIVGWSTIYDTSAIDMPTPPPDNAGLPLVVLSDIGHKIETTISKFSQIYPDVHIDEYVIMPNHVHMILVVDGRRRSVGYRSYNVLGIIVPTLCVIIENMKRLVSMQYKFPVWEESFHREPISSLDDYRRIAEYIKNNPVAWYNKRAYYGGGVDNLA